MLLTLRPVDFFFRREDVQAGDQSGEHVLGGDGGVRGLRLRRGETAQLDEEAPGRTLSRRHREAHVLAMFEELHTRVAPEEAHEVRMRPGAEGPVSLLLREDEAARSRLQAYPPVSPGSERLRDRP